MKIHNFIIYLLLVFMAAGSMVCFVLLYWMLWPYPLPLVVKNYSFTTPLHVETPTVHAGDVLAFDFDYCKNVDVPGKVYRTFIDGQTVGMVPKDGNLPVGCNNTVSRGTVIPDTIEPGRYFLVVEVDYQVNPIRTIAVKYATEYFQVVPVDIPSTSSPPPGETKPALPPVDEIKNVSITP